MNILALDTSTQTLSLAVSKDEKILACQNIHLEKRLSSSIVTEIQKILTKTKFSLAQLDGFAVGLGPGSFTSLRVGLSTIKGLSFATGKPVVGIPSLDIWAAAALEDGNVCAATDAKRNMVYAAVYQKKNGTLKQKGKYSLAPMETILQRLPPKVTFVGDAPDLKNSRPKFPDARFLIALTLDRFRKRQYDNIETLVPLYLYSADCQVT